VQDILTLLVRYPGRGIATPKKGLNHEATLLSERGEDSLSWRLVVVEQFLRICEPLPEFTFFHGQPVLSLGHGD
jgi:hypothetical protein